MLQNPSKGVPREMRIPPPKMSPSADNPRLSDAVAVAQDDLAGRHVVTLRQVRVGEVVAFEAGGGGGEGGVVRLTRPEVSLSNCLACLSSVIIPVPCSGCANVVFCSLKCRLGSKTIQGNASAPVSAFKRQSYGRIPSNTEF